MAGYFIDGCHLDDTPEEHVHSVHIHPGAAQLIEDMTQSRVLTIQVDGDERAAILWGLANYRKEGHNGRSH